MPQSRETPCMLSYHMQLCPPNFFFPSGSFCKILFAFISYYIVPHFPSSFSPTFCHANKTWLVTLCATSRKVVGSIPLWLIGIYHWLNPSDRSTVLESTQPLTEISTKNISWGSKGGRCVGLTNLPPSCADCLEIPGASTSWSPKGLSRSAVG